MRKLPPLNAAVLWAADRSAALLEDTLAAHPGDTIDALAAQLRADPPMARWTVLAAWQIDGSACDTPRRAAQWLSTRGVLLFASATEPDQPPPDADDLAWHVERTLLACAICEAMGGGPEAVWLTLLADPEAPPSTDHSLPPTLLDPPPELQALAERARAIAAGHQVPPDGIDMAACASSASADRARWQAAIVRPAGALLAALARSHATQAVAPAFHEELRRQKIEALAEFAAGAGHEINNPLTVIAGRAQLLLSTETHPERRHDLALINAQAMRIREMIADLRHFARPAAPQWTTIDLNAMVVQLIDEVRPLATAQQTDLVGRTLDGPVQLDADATQLAVAIRAMLANALESLAHGGTVAVQLSANPEWATLSVLDDGPGLAPGAAEHLFDPFYSARQAGRGLGLGLSKCWQIVRMHGGQIEVDCPSGGGVLFQLVLPRASKPRNG